MPASSAFSEIENNTLREYVQNNLNSLVSDVDLTLNALQHLPATDRVELNAAGETYFTSLVQNLVPEWNWDQIKTEISKRVWRVFCNEENGQGKPDSDWLDLFKEGTPGRTVIESAVVAAFSALGAAVGGPIGGLIGGAVGGFIRQLVTKFVSKLLDDIVRDGMDSYCMRVPA